MVIEAVRIVVIAILLADILLLPSALRAYVRPARITLLVLGVDLLILTTMGRLISNLHSAVKPYGLPVAGPAALALAAYTAQALWAQHQGRYNHE